MTQTLEAQQCYGFYVPADQNENHAISDSFGFGFSHQAEKIDKKILSFRLKRWLIQSKKTKSLFQDELIQLSAEERALGSDYELEKALGSK